MKGIAPISQNAGVCSNYRIISFSRATNFSKTFPNTFADFVLAIRTSKGVSRRPRSASSGSDVVNAVCVLDEDVVVVAFYFASRHARNEQRKVAPQVLAFNGEPYRSAFGSSDCADSKFPRLSCDRIAVEAAV